VQRKRASRGGLGCISCFGMPVPGPCLRVSVRLGSVRRGVQTAQAGGTQTAPEEPAVFRKTHEASAGRLLLRGPSGAKSNGRFRSRVERTSADDSGDHQGLVEGRGHDWAHCDASGKALARVKVGSAFLASHSHSLQIPASSSPQALSPSNSTSPTSNLPPSRTTNNEQHSSNIRTVSHSSPLSFRDSFCALFRLSRLVASFVSPFVVVIPSTNPAIALFRSHSPSTQPRTHFATASTVSIKLPSPIPLPSCHSSSTTVDSITRRT
jgi:hypothetical protein